MGESEEKNRGARPEEFTIHIEPDGRIILDGQGMRETNFRRIIELLEETVGPVQQLEVSPSDPPERLVHSTQQTEDEELHRTRIGLEPRGGVS